MTDYTDSGFDKFMSRSDEPQANLDSPAPQSSQIKYDFTQQSGKSGDSTGTEDVRIDADGLTINNGKMNVFDATGKPLIVNGNPFIKIVKGTYNISSVDYNNSYAKFNFQHNLGITPIVVGSVTYNSSTYVLPHFRRQNSSYYGAFASGTVVIENVDDVAIYCRMDILDIYGLSIFLNALKLSFVFYCSAPALPE